MDGEALEKSYVPHLGAMLNDLSGQLPDLAAATSPAVDPRQAPARPGAPRDPGLTQPGETTNGSDGSMITATPSQSGDASMHVGAGRRA